MTTPAWTQPEVYLAQRLVREGLNTDQVSKELEKAGCRRTQQAVRRLIQRKRKLEEGWWARVATNPPCAPRFDKPLRVEADNSLIMIDVHAPFHDADWCNRVIDLALRWHVDTAAVAGDLVDFSAFSKWGRQERVEAEDEINSATQFVKVLCSTFARLIYSAGNHDNRLPRKTDNLLALRNAMQLFTNGTKTEITDYHWFELISGGERYYVEHPKNASVHAMIVPKHLASKYLCHIIAGHGHTWGMTRDASDTFWCIDSGICADPERLAYTHKVHTTRPKEVQGAVLVLDGIPVLVAPHNIAFYERK